MKLLLLGHRYSDLAKVKNASGVWSHYLEKEFVKRGVELRFDPQVLEPKAAFAHCGKLDLSDIDHVLALGVRYFTRIPAACGMALMRRCKGAVTQLHDHFVFHVPCHCTFSVCDDARPHRSHRSNVAVGWAADPDLLVPAQSSDELRILIDHPLYREGRDVTGYIRERVYAFVKSGIWQDRFKSVRVRRIVDDDVIDDGDLRKPVRPYNRRAVPFMQICKEYAQAHIFMPTHNESVGMSVLESAMAGSLVVTPNWAINRGLLTTVRHVAYDSKIDWTAVLEAIDPHASRGVALANNWDAVASRILDYLERWRP
jgi:hypothetical protein